MKVGRLGMVVCASVSLIAGCGDASDSTQSTTEGIVRGKVENKLPQVVAVRINGYNGWTLCSGTYFASRMVVTAAHCLRSDTIPGQTFVYYGADYEADLASLPVIPAPGQPSVWARVETSVAHPDYKRTLHYPDLALMYLDRELPFAPIPLLRTPLTSADKKGEIAGWGGSKALVADITQVEGAGIKRSAKVKLLGSPTEADYHPDDPNPGILDPTIRPNLLKTDGMAPSANTCAGDSGGPLLVESKGRTYLAGVGFWTGLFCEDYAIFTRVASFLGFFDDALTLAGKAPIVPRLECVEPVADGSFLAHFGYSNDNALTVNIPYGRQNLFAADTAQARPSAFEPGDNAFDFAVPFTGGTQLSWKLTPPCGTSTTVLAGATSPVCDPTDPTFVCAKKCDAQFAAECADANASRPACIPAWVSLTTLFSDYYPSCAGEWNGSLGCIPALPPAAANWDCSSPGPPPLPLSPNCDAELNAVYVCLGY